MLTDSRKDILRDLKGYRNSMTEFNEDEMDYLISLVERDLNVS